MKKYIQLAELLFQMENETIGHDAEMHWDFNNWKEKFGKNSIMFEPRLTSTEQDHEELAKLIKADFEQGEWKENPDGSLYNYLMPDFYADHITKVYERQLANLTKVGTQTVLELN